MMREEIDGHDEPCCYCNEPCNALDENPSRWPALKVGHDYSKWHHMGCYMTPLRRERLLMLARGSAWHKHFYSQYYWLVKEGLIIWQLGTASLTPAGEAELARRTPR